MDRSQQPPHDDQCTCKACHKAGMGAYGDLKKHEQKILKNLDRIEVHIELRFYDKDGRFTERSEVTTVKW